MIEFDETLDVISEGSSEHIDNDLESENDFGSETDDDSETGNFVQESDMADE